MTKNIIMATQDSRPESPSWGRLKVSKGHAKGGLKDFFLGKPSFDRHVKAQGEHRLRYMAGFAVLAGTGADIPTSKLTMMASWRGIVIHIIVPLWEELTSHRWIPLAKGLPVKLSFGVFFVVKLNKLFQEQTFASGFTHHDAHVTSL